MSTRFHLLKWPAAAFAAALLLLLGACGSDPTPAATDKPTLKISSIPDQDPDKLVARDGAMAAYLTKTLGVTVEYVPVTDYAASVTLFRSGDLDLVFYGGLTGVQARLQTTGSVPIAQRDIDAEFTSVFIANSDADIEPFTTVDGLTALKGKRLTFGSETSTSGRLMPEYFLDQGGVSTATDLDGLPGYSGSHDKTVDLVESGTYEVGALNSQVWERRLTEKTVDVAKVQVVFTTPTYHDYHWLAGPETDKRFGAGFADKIKAAMLAIDAGDPEQVKLLELYGAGSFIATSADNYGQIEEIGRKLKLIS